MTIHDSILNQLHTVQNENERDVMVKLRLKRCGRKQRATSLCNSLFKVSSFLFLFILLSSLYIYYIFIIIYIYFLFFSCLFLWTPLDKGGNLSSYICIVPFFFS
nr:30S ribosomal protein S16 [Cymbidium qiubeiense]